MRSVDLVVAGGDRPVIDEERHEDDDGPVDEAIMGPLPTANIFKGLAFILTRSRRPLQVPFSFLFFFFYCLPDNLPTPFHVTDIELKGL